MTSSVPPTGNNEAANSAAAPSAPAPTAAPAPAASPSPAPSQYGSDRPSSDRYARRGPRDRYESDRGGDRRGGDRRGGRRPRRRVCAFCVDKITKIDYKEHQRLRDFVSDRGKILKSRMTGTCARHQRALSEAIKRARQVALLPFTAE